MLEPTRFLTISVTGAAAAALPPTWGQLCIWQWHGIVDQDEAVFDNGQSCHVCYYIPDGCDLDTLADAIGQVLHSHDALRTTLEIADGELAGQLIAGSGEFPIEIHVSDPGDAESVADTIAKELSARPWTCREWPVRVSVVTVAGRPDFIVTAYNRLLIDVQSMESVIDEMSKLASGRGGELVPRWQSGQETRHELAPAGAAISDRAVRYWRTVLTQCPPSMFDFPPPPPDELRYVMAEMQSISLARAVRVLRKRWRVPEAALVLGALALVLGQHTGHRAAVVQLFAGNRTDRDRRRMLGTLLSEGLMHIDLTGASFAVIARGAAKAISAANQFAYCDPAAVAAVREEIQLSRGAFLDLAVYYNDMQTGQEALDQSDPVEPEPEERSANGSGLSAPDTWSGWDRAWQAKVTRKDIRLLLTAQHGATMPLLLFCDTAYLSRETMRLLLCGMERLLVAAASSGDVDGADLASVTGVPEVARDAGWVRLATGWVDVAATSEVWRTVTGSEACAVMVEEDADGHRLVGYLASAAQPLFAELHQQFVAAIRGRDDTRAPATYRWVATVPARPEDAAAWARERVLSEDDGRG
ncbi:condensation domain-containing protein [Solihabitans fulvus]|uniref:condensation domain-containing protein n=1 Tax=Solihabitans fulvus TaxID=1892852 RepID=UPI001661BF7C|nr:condensation domain-containing protein [Solihabitans fulvus]